MSIEVSTADRVSASECISCNECVNSCPAVGALQIKTPTGKTATPAVMTALVVATTIAIIGVRPVAGALAWTMPSLGEAIEQRNGVGGDSGAEAGNGSFDTTLIEGYMSMKEISEATGVPAEAFIQKWGVPASDLDKPMKEIKDQYGSSPDDVKVWVAEELAQ